MMSKDVRRARQPGSDLGLKVIFAVLLLILVLGSMVVIALRVSTSSTGIPVELVEINPLETLVQVLRGEIQWTTTASIVVAAQLAVVAMVGWIMLLLRSRRAPHARVDQVRHLLGGSEDKRSLSREAAVRAAKRSFGSELASSHPGLMIGHEPGKERQQFWSTWEDLYLIIFGPRMGKTTSQVIPAIVDAPGVVVTTSNKRDIVDETIGVTSARGDVYVFDPQRIAHGFDQEQWYFDPLDAIRLEPDLMDSAAMKLADIFMTASRGDGGKGGDPYFTEAGRDFLGRLMLAAALENRPIGDVYLWVNDDSDRTPVGVLGKYPEWSQQAAALAATYQITERTRSGIFAQAAQMAAPLGRREALKWVTPVAGAARFSPDDFVRSSADTLYVLSKEGADNAAALSTALTAAVMIAAERYGEANGGRLPVPLVAPLDEAANVVKWPELPALYSHYGSRSIILMTILQSYTQGVGVWGEEGMEALWSASSILLYGGGVRDEKMLSKMEALIGDAQELSRSTSTSKDGRTVSRQMQDKKILTSADLASQEEWRAVIFAFKRRPIVAQLVPWWERSWPTSIRKRLKQGAS